jgi:transposase
MSVTLGDMRPSYSTVKNWVTRFRTDHLSTEEEEPSRRPTQVTIPENVDAIHPMILDDRRISAKKTAETLAISREEEEEEEEEGYVIHEILGMRKLSAKWFPKFLNADHNRILALT